MDHDGIGPRATASARGHVQRGVLNARKGVVAFRLGREAAHVCNPHHRRIPRDAAGPASRRTVCVPPPGEPALRATFMPT